MASQSVVVLDTNVIISAWLSANGIPGVIFRRFLMGDFELLTSNSQLAEIESVARRAKLKKYLKPGIVAAGLNFLKTGSHVTIVRPKKCQWDFPDIKDHFLLDLISSESPDFFVTGDQLLLSLVEIEETPICSPAHFLQII